jgi:hypothetical protein
MEPVEQEEGFGVAGAGDFAAQIARPAAVAQRIQAGAGLAGSSARSGGLERVGAPRGQRARRRNG